MLVKIRTLKNLEAELEVSPTDTIHMVQQKIKEKFPEMTPEQQRLIHGGKILNKELAIQDYPDIKPNDRIVVMLTKSQNAPTKRDLQPPVPVNPTPAVSTPTPKIEGCIASPPASLSVTPFPQTQNQSITPSAEQPAAAAPPSEKDAAEAPKSSVTTEAPLHVEGASSVMLTGAELEEVTNNMCALGFDKAEVTSALRIAFNNPDRAMEYLINGFPDAQAADIPQAPPPSHLQQHSTDAPATPLVPPGGNPLEALRNHPQFELYRRLIQTNPEYLTQLLSLIGQSNPALLAVMAQNQDALMQMLQEPVEGGGDMLPPNTVRLSPSDVESVEQLERLGFSRASAVEAYLACDRNQELAANYLFENASDSEEQEES